MNPSTQPSQKQELNRILLFSFLIMIMLAFFASGCKETCDKQLITYQEPVWAPISEARVNATYKPAREMESPGKIYYKDDYLFITDTNKGIHVIDNREPMHPKTVGFIDLPGTKDLAAKGDYLYADNYMDLVVLDISDKANIREINRVEDVFNQYHYYDQQMGVLVDWETVEEVVEVDCDDPVWIDRGWWGRTDVVFALESSADGGNTGIGGSMARFTIMENYLYALNDWSVKVFDIASQTSPEMGNEVQIGWGMETIFPHEDKLFFGARSGMHIYDNSNPAEPTYISSYMHVNACDPVVVKGDYAYVTLRSGTECETFTNQLDVVDISDIQNPELVITHDMQNPHGLGINGTCLFIAEGDYGLKVFDATDIMSIGNNMLAHHQNVHALDVIPLNDMLFMIGDDGLHQYRYDCEENFTYLSTIRF